MSTEYWANEVKRLGELLDRAEAAHDSFTFDELYPAYVTAQDEYRQAVLEQCPFTGWGL